MSKRVGRVRTESNARRSRRTNWEEEPSPAIAPASVGPAALEFGELPKTSTGKVQKYVLREREWQGLDKRIH